MAVFIFLQHKNHAGEQHTDIGDRVLVENQKAVARIGADVAVQAGEQCLQFARLYALKEREMG